MKEWLKKLEFSKLIIVQESLLVWGITIAFVILAFQSVAMGYLGSLPWLTVLCGSVWGAYGVSVSFYYNKSKAENTAGGIKYQSVVGEMLDIDELVSPDIRETYEDYQI